MKRKLSKLLPIWAKNFIFGPPTVYYCREGAACVNFHEETKFTASEPFICVDCEDMREEGDKLGEAPGVLVDSPA